MSKRSFPVGPNTDRKGKGRKAGRMDSCNTFTTQFSWGKDSEVLSLLRLRVQGKTSGSSCGGVIITVVAHVYWALMTHVVH